MMLDEKLDFRRAELPDPVREAGEVLIRVQAAAHAILRRSENIGKVVLTF